jgi:hypothetical protein
VLSKFQAKLQRSCYEEIDPRSWFEPVSTFPLFDHQGKKNTESGATGSGSTLHSLGPYASGRYRFRFCIRRPTIPALLFARLADGIRRATETGSRSDRVWFHSAQLRAARTRSLPLPVLYSSTHDASLVTGAVSRWHPTRNRNTEPGAVAIGSGSTLHSLGPYAPGRYRFLFCIHLTTLIELTHTSWQRLTLIILNVDNRINHVTLGP